MFAKPQAEARDVMWYAAVAVVVLQRSVLVTAEGEQVQGEDVVLFFGIIDILQVRHQLLNCYRVVESYLAVFAVSLPLICAQLH
jgi:hypothetical protein